MFSNGIRKVIIGDSVIALFDAHPVRDAKYIRMGVALGRGEFKASHFKQLPIGIAEVN